MSLKIESLFPMGTAALAEEKIKKFFEPQDGEPAPACYVIYLAPVMENGKQKINVNKDIFGRIKSEEPATEIVLEPCTENVLELNQKLYNDLVKRHEQILLLEQSLQQMEEVKNAYRNLKREYDNLLALTTK